MFVFFFSSRRRHTRLVSDWSSDVCSSDLLAHGGSLAGEVGGEVVFVGYGAEIAEAGYDDYAGVDVRSEERRVGKSVDLGGGRMSKKKSRDGCVAGRRELRVSRADTRNPTR